MRFMLKFALEDCIPRFKRRLCRFVANRSRLSRQLGYGVGNVQDLFLVVK